MKKNQKRLFSWFLALTILLGTAMPAAAADVDADVHTHTHASAAEDASGVPESAQTAEDTALPVFTVDGSDTVYTLNTESITFSGLDEVPLLMNTDDIVIDETDPAILTFEAELREIKVLNEDGESVPLTEEQIQTVLYMYQQYLDHWEANADVLGVQLPFFLQYNDNGEDGLGILGEMLALAGVPVDAVRAGQMSYDDLTGMIQNFMFGDQLGVQLYGEEIRAARDEVLALIEASGAQTEAQKLLILNDWLAHIDTFDMPYIMNTDKEPGVDAGTMVAEDPQPHEHYQTVYDAIYAVYEEQIDAQFRQQIEDGLIANLTQQVYEAAIRDIVWQQAYNSYLNDNHTHVLKAEFTWTDAAEGAEAPTAAVAVVCDVCDVTPAEIGDVVVALDEESCVAATCAAEGTDVYVASVVVSDAELGIEETTITSNPHEVTTAVDPINHAGAALNAEVADWTVSPVAVTVSCSACEASVVVEDAVPEENVVQPETCTENGSKTLTVTGEVADEATGLTGEYTAETTVVIPAAHKFDENEVCTECGETSESHVHEPAAKAVFTWTEKEEGGYSATADVACATCGALVIDDADAVVSGPSVVTPAACEADGTQTYTATLTVAGGDSSIAYTEEKEETIPATGHTWTEAYTWSVDETGAASAVANFSCESCNAVVENEKADSIRSSTTASTCTVAGSTVYTATFDTAIGEYTDTYTVTLPLAAHTTSETSAVFSWEAAGTGGYTATAIVYCDVCGNPLTETVSAAVSGPVTENEANCYADGSEVYTAEITVTVEGTETTFTDTKTDVIPATGAHVYGEDGVCTTDGCTAVDPNYNAGGEGEDNGGETPADPEEVSAEGSLVDMMEGETTEEKTEDELAAEAYADEVADQYMEDNAEAISADARGFVVEKFGEDVAQQIDAQVEYVIEDARTNGIEVDPVNYPGYKMTIDEIVEQQMNTPMADLPQKYDENGNPVVDENGDPVHMTPNEAVPVYAAQAAEGLTEGVLNYWEGTQFGALAGGTSVCLGYAKAFAYLVQCMHPELYGVNGAETDMTVAENWKDAKDLYYAEDGTTLDITRDYAVDLVRVAFDASVTMFGETQDNFNSDHFWNAVKVDGQWYYVDPCYTDVFTEVMVRDRVETDGSMNHLYFMFSHDAAVSMYDGNYKEIKTLYAEAATATDYEDSWMSRVKSNVYSDGEYFYYIYESTDMLTMLEEESYSSDTAFKLVRHKISGTDAGTNGDSDYETLIHFNYQPDEDSDSYVAVYDTEGVLLSESYSAFLTELYAEHAEAAQIYPSIALTAALYDGKVYFNLNNCILTYDLSTSDVEVVKEYNTVYGLRDKTNPFGGMAFSVVDSAEEATFTVENHPIAGLTIKNDGKMYVSIATNFAYISGNESQTGYGYAYEESNYNAGYSNYDTDDYDDSMLESFGYEKEVNDNDEFMWAANFVETLDMSHVAGGSHSYAEVSVDAFCGQNAFIENRCTECGFIEADTRVEEEGTAHEHHYIYFVEEFYTKDDSGNINTGSCYVCAECGYHISKPTEPDPDADYSMSDTTYEEQYAIYEEELAIYEAAEAAAGHDYVPTDAVWSEDSTSVTFSNLICDKECCVARAEEIDIFMDNGSKQPVELALDTAATATATVTAYEGDCTTGLEAIYTAEGTVSTKYGEYKFTAENAVAQPAGSHAYEGTFTWTAVLDEEGNETGEYTAVADMVCSICGDTHEAVAAEVTEDTDQYRAPDCVTDGQRVYTAVAAVYAEDGETVLGSVTESRVDVLPALGHTFETYTDNADDATHTAVCVVCETAVTDLAHEFVDGLCEKCGAAEPVALTTPEILSCYSKLQNSVKVTWSVVEGAEGYELWRATAPDAAEEDWKCVKTINDGATDRYTNQLTDEEIGITFYYSVRAFRHNAAGEKVYSEFSAVSYMPAAVVWNGPVAPHVPYSNSTSRIRLLWQEISGAHGYQIWRLNAEDGTWSIVKTLGDRGNELTDNQGATTAYSNTGLTAGETYTYKMRAFMITDDGRKVFGAYSDEYSVAVMPEVTTMTLSSPRTGRALVEWTAVNGAAGYQIWMSDAEDGEYTIAKSITDGSTSYTKKDLESGKTYYFKIRAYSEVDGKKTFGAYTEIGSVVVK